jgi:hypothetical protein
MFCPQCGKEIDEGRAFCGYCGAALVEPGATAAVGAGRSKTAWEDRENIGFFNGLLKTVKQVLFSPAEFFKKMPVSGGLIDPLLYALIVGMVGLMFQYFWQIVLGNSMQSFMPQELKSAAVYDMFHGLGRAMLAVFSPLLLVIGLFISAGCLHLFLMMVNGARGRFEATFRVVSYGLSPYPLLLIPFCGNIIAALWTLVLTLIGLKEAHETTGGKAAFAVFFPFIICCGLLVLVSILFMGAIAASFGALMHTYK